MKPAETLRFDNCQRVCYTSKIGAIADGSLTIETGD
jgi:hypothetical protein